MRATIVSTLLLAAAAAAQTPPAKLAFEVASIKPAEQLDPAKMMSGQAHVGMKIDAARVDIGFLSTADLIRLAYKLKSYQLIGPEWLTAFTAQRWDIMAKMPPGADKDQVPQMLQVLLAERFKLEFHKESKEHNAYALTVAKSGLKMKEAAPEPTPAKAEPAPPGSDPTPPPGNNNPQIKMTGSGDTRTVSVGASSQGGPMKMTVGPNGMHMEADALPMDALIELLSKLTDRPVVDMTELKGKYQMALDLSMADMMAMARSAGVMGAVPGGGGGETKAAAPADAASDPANGSAFKNVQQLGLELKARKIPIEIIVVDKVEKAPTEN
jgi:uncharacterized protein (TIGR03435 family)